MKNTRKLLSVLLPLAMAVACSDPASTSFNDASAPGVPDAHSPDATQLGDASAGDDASMGDDANDAAEDATLDASDAGDTSSADAAADASDASDQDADHTTLPPGAVIGSCDPSHWTLTASDSHPVNPTRYALDALPPTRWSTGVPQAPGQYLQIDFGGYVLVDSVMFDNSFADKTDYARAFDVAGSDDGSTFPHAVGSADFTSQDPGATPAVTFPKYAVRAIRMTLNASSGSWWSVHELHVSCTVPSVDAGTDAAADADGAAPDADVDAADADVDATSDAESDATADAGADADMDAAIDAADDADASAPDAATGPIDRTGWSATASNTNGADPIANAFDGNPSTRWATGKLQYGDEWFRIDLGATTTIRQVVLDSNATDYPSAYQLELSNDDVNYTVVTTGLGGPSTAIPFSPQAARYVRIKQIGSGYDKWWCIYEANVFR